MTPHDLTPEEQQLLITLAHRSRESSQAEAQVFEKYGNGWRFAKELWIAVSGLVLLTICSTTYVLSMKSEVDRDRRDIDRAYVEASDERKKREELEKLVWELKSKILAGRIKAGEQ